MFDIQVKFNFDTWTPNIPETCKHQYFLFTYLHKSGGTNLTLLVEDKNPSIFWLTNNKVSWTSTSYIIMLIRSRLNAKQVKWKRLIQTIRCRQISFIWHLMMTKKKNNNNIKNFWIKICLFHFENMYIIYRNI